MTTLFFEPFVAPPADDGGNLPGAKLNFYATGTLTAQATYQDSDLTTPHANPVVADANGRFPPIYLNELLGDYKVVLTDSDDVEIDSIDPYLASAASSVSAPIEKGTSYTTTAADNGKLIVVTASATISLGDADTLGSSYRVSVLNNHSATITVDQDTGADTIDGVASSVRLPPGMIATFVVNTSADGFFTLAMYSLRHGLNIGADYSERAVNAGTGGATTLDLSDGTYFYMALASSPTFTFSNPAPSGRVSSFTLEMTDGANNAPTFPGSVIWHQGDEPTWSDGLDIVSFLTRDAGTTWIGSVVGLDIQ